MRVKLVVAVLFSYCCFSAAARTLVTLPARISARIRVSLELIYHYGGYRRNLNTRNAWNGIRDLAWHTCHGHSKWHTTRSRSHIPLPGTVPGFILSGALLSILIFAVTYFALPWHGTSTSEKYFLIGFGWLILTLAFEFIFGHLVQGKPWSQLF